MKNIFNSVKIFRPKSSTFDLSHDVKLSCEMAELVPIMVTECVPGDKFNISAEALVRFAPMVAPVMHRIDVTMHYFFVPNRLVWENWEKFITNDESAPAFPFITVGPILDNWYDNPLLDYMGIPDPNQNSGASVNENISALPFAAYQLIYDQYYRDQNLITSDWTPLADGDNSADITTLCQLRKRCWEHDYFTASLPFAQKGDAVEIPITGEVVMSGNTPYTPEIRKTSDGSLVTPDTNIMTTTGGYLGYEVTGDGVNAYLDPNGTLEVQNADTTINDLRRATALQKFLEKLARGGSRYIEQIKTMFGVNSSDKRLQRPEYITGTKSPVIISEVLNTTGTTEAPQGDMAGHGVSVTSGQQGSYYCEEHGYIIGIMSIMPKTAYYQGIPKHFLKTSDPYQYYFPDFANIGEQEVQNRELYSYTALSGSTFGYVPRYAEYKFENNRVAGLFRDQLDFWHMGREFAVLPSLNGTFVTANPTKRIFAVTDPETDSMWCHVFNKVYASRLMPKYGTPTF